MSIDRPNPDALLAEVQSEAARARRGKLTIFFGYAAGVGKSYAMLQAAQRERASGTDVVVGYVELHGRLETEALLNGLETLPPRLVEYRGVTLREFDLDAALARRPQVVLVDELAHTNAEGSRHAKRWQDVDELLAAEIDVYTTLNVQHIESLNDVIAQITGVAVRETLPDHVFESADEIELIDLTPDELVERLRAGKVYVPEKAQRAIEKFFQRGNLSALRELSLRRTADRLNADVQQARRGQAARLTWPTTERLLVCVGPSPRSAKVIRSAKRLASTLRAEWIAACVETPRAKEMSDAARQSLLENLQLAERLGAETVTLTGSQVADEIISYARSRNVTKIVIGKTDEPKWKTLLKGSVVDDLLRQSGEIDVYVIRGIEAKPLSRAGTSRPSAPRSPSDNTAISGTAVIVLLCTLTAWGMSLLKLSEANVAMVFLLGVLFAAARFGRRAGVIASVATVLAFDFFFVPPYYTFSVNDGQYLITFAIMLLIALVTSNLTVRIREQVESSRLRERRTESLYRLSRQLAGASGSEFLVTMAGRQVKEILGGEVIVLLPDDGLKLQVRVGHETSVAHNATDLVVAQWVYEHQQIAGAGTDTLPNATALFVPLAGSQGNVGVLGVKVDEIHRLHAPDQRQLLETCASLIALAIERDKLALESQQVMVQAESERLRSSLLSAVSHDLRTPLAAIAGASSSLLELPHGGDETTRRELLQTVVDESHRLARLVDNLLEMTRIESGAVQIHKQWNVLEEVVGSALHHAKPALGNRPIRVELPHDLPLIPLDGVLIEQVLVNILENAAKYSPTGTPVEIQARHGKKQIVVEVLDRGHGLAPGDERRVFEKFYRGENAVADGRRGVGLGLAICQAIVEAHGGTIHAANRPDGGARFWFTLPLEGTPPKIDINPASDS